MSQLPALAGAWGIVDASLIADGIGGRVWSVTLGDGRPAIVKQPSALALQDGEPPRAVAYLRWRDGHGSARLIDTQGDLQLLEFAGDQTLLDVFHRDGDDAATKIACDVLARLHAPSNTPAPPVLQPLAETFASLFAKAEADRAARNASQFADAASIAEALLASQPAPIPLHGDIHHENIILGPRGWLTIDPKGFLGDPAFDAANLFYNPVEEAIRANPARAARMSVIISARLGFDRARLLDWAFAFSALSASWHVEDGNLGEAGRSLAVGRAVRDARAAL
jgi:streptomycin 6-kinase